MITSRSVRNTWCLAIAANFAAIGVSTANAQDSRGMRGNSAAPKPVTAAPAATGAVSFTISNASAEGQMIRVAVNKGLLLDFNVPIRELRMANPEIADVQPTAPNQVLLNGKSFGTTQLIVWTEGDQQRIFDVAVEIDMERLRASISAAAPRSAIKANSVLDTVVLTGTVNDVEVAQRVMQVANIYSQRVINQIRVAGVQQVLLRCTVAEMNRSSLKQLGINGWLGGENFRDAFAVNQLDGINPINIGAAGTAPITQNVPFITDQQGIPISGNTTLSLGFPRAQLQVFLRALRENSLLKVLAEPNLVAISGQDASFLAGGEFPVPVPQGGAIGAVTIEYREFGVRLSFTPVVVSEGLIRLRVAPEVSEPDLSNAVTLGGFVVPGLISRRVETTVELAAGQTFAIGGLLSQSTRAVSRAVPALGDVPVLGALFRSVEFQTDETELIVLVTPELVSGISPDQITHVPGSQYVKPNDWELFGLGKIEGEESVKGNNLPKRPDNRWPANPQSLYPSNTGPMRVRGPIGPAGLEEGN
ncbi:MAG: type II and III secretion system protein family protein [Phycisphaerae bacterium]|nr:type II and III secretion system protein family protein [Phycisphaerae bacterium]